ncbi:hypothetical protein PAECIP111893_02786 [Paenibacillus plantiphilus]|uniref:Extracellular solute-binding protein n=1 Tax=Paenibacillus plantiphilus TaxID=2905650 RepID=A0ABN8GNL6_9BACL|nr:ABC transporter substrate-binding protein [Paenibacillus plantiphilus]CAH1207809.1 hypothetical protein PAECIP111893_02786 [Paenibacillus plantiphilus]
MNRYRRPLAMLLSFLMLAVMAAGCTSNTEEAADEKVLRIAVDSENYYNYKYADYIEAAFPALKVELVEMNPEPGTYLSVAEYTEKIKKEKPDLILTNDFQYRSLATEGLLLDLSTLMTGSGMKEDDFYTGMTELMKRNADGKLYGLSSIFEPTVLFYNESLFKEYGVDPPTGGMSLEEVYELGSRFVSAGGGKDGVLGVHQAYLNMPLDVLDKFGSAEGIRFVNYATGQMTMETPLWRHLIEKVVQLYQFGTLSMVEVKGKVVDGVTYFDENTSTLLDLYSKGEAAMTVAYYGAYPPQLDNGDIVGYVAPPVSSSDRQRSAHMYVFTAMAIGAEAENSEMAWNVMRFLTSDHMVKVRTKLGTNEGVSTNKSYLNVSTDPVMKQLFEINPIIKPSDAKSIINEMKFMESFRELMNTEVAAAVKGERSIDELIATLQKEGQSLLEVNKKPE